MAAPQDDDWEFSTIDSLSEKPVTEKAWKNHSVFFKALTKTKCFTTWEMTYTNELDEVPIAICKLCGVKIDFQHWDTDEHIRLENQYLKKGNWVGTGIPTHREVSKIISSKGGDELIRMISGHKVDSEGNEKLKSKTPQFLGFYKAVGCRRNTATVPMPAEPIATATTTIATEEAKAKANSFDIDDPAS